MIAWLVAAAVAGPPEGVMSEEVGTWAPYWSVIQEGPLGCWEVTGTAAWDWDLGRYGITRGGAAFAARLEDGVWKDFFVRSLGETRRDHADSEIRTYPHDAMHFAPLVGRLAPEIFETDEMETNILEQILGVFGSEVTTTWSEWSDARRGVVLHRILPVGEGGRAEGALTVLFPDGGTSPTELDLQLDQPFPMPDHPAVRVRSGEIHLRGRQIDGQVWPESESFSLAASILGYRVWASQTIQYDIFRPCGGASELEAVPLIP